MRLGNWPCPRMTLFVIDGKPDHSETYIYLHESISLQTLESGSKREKQNVISFERHRKRFDFEENLAHRRSVSNIPTFVNVEGTKKA